MIRGMKDTAVLQGRFWHRGGLLLVVPLAVAALLLAGLVESASAAKLVGKDGRVYACYQVKQGKGKAKGSVRLVTKKAPCKRGERKLNWGVAGPPGAQGATGQSGAAGPQGPPGTNGLEKQVTELSTRVESLEATLAGVTNDTLTQALTTVNGITNAQLQETIGSLADVNALCEQTEDLTAQANGILGSLEETALGGLIPIGLSLLVPNLPNELSPFSC